ncbi:hypothetical protein P171DRAFT_432529 [Karstenula rhodostoma CBS 690.94]|uniref:Uncharacterized protein n=1 Tax=Karstenula rhodostoma CBS 690.94 TaxID=1392251 RepID=A0A9P4UCM3_9PLEO|nr:hypothetical protein P171DRAFT_432529 [Karstenula rhodostoma CBS 690.94]
MPRMLRSSTNARAILCALRTTSLSDVGMDPSTMLVPHRCGYASLDLPASGDRSAGSGTGRCGGGMSVVALWL